jgi:hypothetical protein
MTTMQPGMIVTYLTEDNKRRRMEIIDVRGDATTGKALLTGYRLRADGQQARRGYSTKVGGFSTNRSRPEMVSVGQWRVVED